MDTDTRIKTYKSASDDIRSLYASEKIGEYLHKVGQDYNIESQKSLVEVVGDTILGFHLSKDLPQLLQKEVGLSADEAQKVTSELAELLSPVLERESSKKQTELRELEQQFADKQESGLAEESDAEEEGDSPSDTGEPHDVHDVTPMRTMKGDMQRIHGYGAYRDQYPTDDSSDAEPVVKSEQDSVLQKQPLVETPKVEE